MDIAVAVGDFDQDAAGQSNWPEGVSIRITAAKSKAWVFGNYADASSSIGR